MSRGRYGWFTAALFCHVSPVIGCYSILGVKHDYEVAKELTPGLGREDALSVLAGGARAQVGAETPRPDTGDWPDEIYAPGVREELDRAEETTEEAVMLILRVDRHWGFFGYGVFHLFLSREERLLGFHLFHIN